MTEPITAILTPRLSCRVCGVQRRANDGLCYSCQDHRPAVRGFVQPTKRPNLPRLHPPYPWREIPWPPGAVFSLDGDEGIGKSSIAGLLHDPKGAEPSEIGAWITTEQDPGEVALMFDRLQRPCPVVYPCDPADQYGSGLRYLAELVCPAGQFVIVDSVTEMGVHDGARFVSALIEACRTHGWRGIAISQRVSDGTIAGSSRIKFRVQIRGKADRTAFGRRAFRVTKSRFGGEFTNYYTMRRDGTVGPPSFASVAHSIEGEIPLLDLVPYGFASGSVAGTPGQNRGKRIQYAGLLDALAPYNLLPQLAGRASAATPSVATTCGFLEPEDLDHRQAMAEQHGLPWLSLEEGLDLLIDARAEADGDDTSQAQ